MCDVEVACDDSFRMKQREGHDGCDHEELRDDGDHRGLAVGGAE
jgi:hypothetical protein